MSLLSPPDSNVKLSKSQGLGYLPYGLSLAPADLSGRNVCAWSTVGCVNPCVGGERSGRAKFLPEIMVARIRKTRWYFDDRAGFMEQLAKEIEAAHRKAQRQSLNLALRLNVFSDLEWRLIKHPAGWTIFDAIDELPGTRVYDYTKSIRRATRELTTDYKTRWHNVFSKSEVNHAECLEFLRQGGSVAIPFAARMHALPRWHDGYRVVDGDLHDLLFLQPKNRVVGLAAKGALKKDNPEGFAVMPRDNVTLGGW